MKVEAHASAKPEELCYNTLTIPKDGNTAEVWIRKNIRKQTVPALSEDAGSENSEWVYDEVYFRTTASQSEIEADIEGYWITGADWEPDVPLTKEEQQEKKIACLEKSLAQAKADLEQSRTDSDMAIAELTIVLASMMTPTSTNEEGGGENV